MKTERYSHVIPCSALPYMCEAELSWNDNYEQLRYEFPEACNWAMDENFRWWCPRHPPNQGEVVYAVYKNQDMTEGRGPMVLDRIYKDEDKAWEYADSQLGVMGRSHKGSWRDSRLYGGDWTVKPMPIY